MDGAEGEEEEQEQGNKKSNEHRQEGQMMGKPDRQKKLSTLDSHDLLGNGKPGEAGGVEIHRLNV